MTFSPPQAQSLKPGFADPVFDAQAAFRAALDAMSYAGRIQDARVAIDPPAPLGAASTLLALALFDFDTTVWLDGAAAGGDAPGFLRFHCGAPITARPIEAQFALIADCRAMPSIDAFAIGEDRYPDRSATLIIEVPSLTAGPKTRWTGPGIDKAIDVQIDGLPDSFWSQWDDNSALYPQGIDIIFTCANQLIGLPRSIKVEA